MENNPPVLKLSLVNKIAAEPESNTLVLIGFADHDALLCRLLAAVSDGNSRFLLADALETTEPESMAEVMCRVCRKRLIFSVSHRAGLEILKICCC